MTHSTSMEFRMYPMRMDHCLRDIFRNQDARVCHKKAAPVLGENRWEKKTTKSNGLSTDDLSTGEHQFSIASSFSHEKTSLNWFNPLAVWDSKWWTRVIKQIYKNISCFQCFQLIKSGQSENPLMRQLLLDVELSLPVLSRLTVNWATSIHFRSTKDMT